MGACQEKMQGICETTRFYLLFPIGGRTKACFGKSSPKTTEKIIIFLAGKGQTEEHDVAFGERHFNVGVIAGYSRCV